MVLEFFLHHPSTPPSTWDDTLARFFHVALELHGNTTIAKDDHQTITCTVGGNLVATPCGGMNELHKDNEGQTENWIRYERVDHSKENGGQNEPIENLSRLGSAAECVHL